MTTVLFLAFQFHFSDDKDNFAIQNSQIAEFDTGKLRRNVHGTLKIDEDIFSSSVWVVVKNNFHPSARTTRSRGNLSISLRLQFSGQESGGLAQSPETLTFPA